MTSPQSQAVAQIQKALVNLPSEADSPWTNLDKMPYIHKTDDPKASPWNCAVVGRFDYLQTMDYMLACQPANIRILLAAIAAHEAEVGRLREALEKICEGAPTEWPERYEGDNHGDTARSASEIEHFHMAEIARAALKANQGETN